MAKIINVSAGIIMKEDDFLLCTRPINRSYAGHWEFPGGKIETNETKEDALIRELYEELNILINKNDIEFFSLVQHIYNDKIVNLNIFKCYSWQGNIIAKEGQKFHWQKCFFPCKLAPQLPTTEKIIKLINNS
jgi:8-oxo-dGTP diphosphatase